MSKLISGVLMDPNETNGTSDIGWGISCLRLKWGRLCKAVVASVGSDEPTPLCAGFKLSDDQAQEFLKRSRLITAQQMLDICRAM